MTRSNDEIRCRPLVTGWLGKVNMALRYRKPFMDVAEQCMAFYTSTLGFMWKPEYRRKYFKTGGLPTPQFQITIAKAFELVALFGPMLYNRNPVRAVRTRKALDLPPDAFGDPNDPLVQQMAQQMGAMEQQRQSQNGIRAQLLERYLNWTPGEQPNGGLQQQAEDAITEALIKGRGILWCETYEMPASPTTITGLFYDSQDNMVIDPDATDLSDAKWIAKRCCHPYWEVERQYGLLPDSLKEKASDRSGERAGVDYADDANNDRSGEYAKKFGKSHDLLTYWKIWSKGGVGTRLKGVSKTMNRAFDEVVGDYAYVVVAEGVPYPLNCGENFLEEATDEEVKKKFSWPLPFWADNRWPCAVLDFYKEPKSPYPVAPLKPGLGELTALNIIVSHLVGRIRSSSRDFVAVLESQAKAVEGPLRNGEDLSIILLKGATGDVDINKVVQFLQQPQTNFDVWKIIDALFQLFDKRTGLTELVYGQSETQSRTAEDATIKKQGISIRPDYMASRVEKWLSEASQLERLALYFGGVSGQTVEPLLGKAGAMLWDQLIANEEPEVVLRELDITVEAGSARKPNKDRDVANINQFLQTFGPSLESYRQQSGDVGPMNAIITQWCKGADMEPAGLMMQPPPPPDPNKPDPQQQELMLKQQEMQAEIAMKEKEAALKERLETVKLQIAQAKGEADIRLMREKAQLELQIETMKLQAEQRRAEQELAIDRQQGELDLAQSQQQAAANNQIARQQMIFDGQRMQQEMRQSDQTHRLGMQQTQAKGKQDLALQKQKASAANGATRKSATQRK